MKSKKENWKINSGWWSQRCVWWYKGRKLSLSLSILISSIRRAKCHDTIHTRLQKRDKKQQTRTHVVHSLTRIDQLWPSAGVWGTLAKRLMVDLKKGKQTAVQIINSYHITLVYPHVYQVYICRVRAISGPSTRFSQRKRKPQGSNYFINCFANQDRSGKSQKQIEVWCHGQRKTRTTWSTIVNQKRQSPDFPLGRSSIVGDSIFIKY